MSHLYLTENGLKIGLDQGQLTVRKAGEKKVEKIPFGTIDSISVYGLAQLSTQLIRRCFQNGIPILYYTEDGHYLGKTNALESVDPFRQKKQIELVDNRQFCFAWAQMIVSVKIKNSIAVLNSMPERYLFQESEIKGLQHSLKMLPSAQSLDEILGHEGNAAKCYFACLAKLVPEEFAFQGRSSRPPKDPMNSMLSYGYSLLHRSIVGAIERHGLHPYFGFMHKLKSGHASLASDLIEEYRAVLIDRSIVNLVNTCEIGPEDFYRSETGAIFMSRGVMKKLSNHISSELSERRKYYSFWQDLRFYSFQSMLDKKIPTLVKAIEGSNVASYKPFVWCG